MTMKKRLNKFDEHIRQQMEHLQPDFDPSNWETFEERLDAAPPSSTVFSDSDLDQLVFDKLHRYEAPYRPEHWDRMKALLHERFTWPQYLLRYKSVELALFLLLFLSFWQYLPRTFAPQDGQRAYQATAAVDELPTIDFNETALTSPPKPSVAEEATDASSEMRPATPPTATVPANSSQGTIPKTLKKDYTAPIRPLPTLGFLPLQPSQAQQTLGHAAEQLANLLKPLPEGPSTPDAMALLDPMPNQAPKLLPTAVRGLDETKLFQTKKRPTLVVGMFATAEYNRILISVQEEKRKAAAIERAAYGYGGGLSLNLDFGRLELQTGLIYAARHYPVDVTYVRGSLLRGLWGDKLETTELNMLNLPLHLRYDVVQRGKWRLYVLGGGAVQVAFQSSYYTADAPEFHFSPIPQDPDNPSPTPNVNVTEINRGAGWFEEGGRFRENAYLSANVGFGAERFLTERWSLFAQPVYQHAFYHFSGDKGLGPNNDRINSMTLLLGTRVRMR